MSGVNKSVRSSASMASISTNKNTSPWMPQWPNSADFPYNYFNLLDKSPKALPMLQGRILPKNLLPSSVQAMVG